jgi:hypothetical protein
MWYIYRVITAVIPSDAFADKYTPRNKQSCSMTNGAASAELEIELAVESVPGRR